LSTADRKPSQRGHLAYKPTPCASCGVIKYGPWPTCGEPACRESYRAVWIKDYRRDFRRVHREAGTCIECGKPRWKNRRLCRNHALAYEAANWRLRQRKGQERARERAALNIANAKAAHAAVNDERVRLGLPVSQAFAPKIPKDTPPPTEG